MEDPQALPKFIQENTEIIAGFQQPNGAYPACPYFHNYQYCWFRDGSFIADSMSRAGYVESAELFFDWCSEVMLGHRSQILDGKTLDARYHYDGTSSKESWEEFQLDGYGLWLWALQEHCTRHKRSLAKYQNAVELTEQYLLKQWRNQCIDWWEERLGHHAATQACIASGLRAINNPTWEQVAETINIENERTDGSLLICGILGIIEPTDFANTLTKIEHELTSTSGGVYRYAEDSYYGGGEWVVLTAMLGWYYVQLGRQDDAKKCLAWIEDHRTEHSWLPEQVQDHLLHPEQYTPWVEKWGSPANPLLWSHGMSLTLASELMNAGITP